MSLYAKLVSLQRLLGLRHIFPLAFSKGEILCLEAWHIDDGGGHR